MTNNQIINVMCENLSYEGLGVCRVENFVIFVPNLLPGEKAEVKLTDVKKSFAYGKVISKENSSSKRVEPLCESFFECGGCDLSHMNSELKMMVKFDSVLNNLRKQKLEVDLVNNISNTDVYGYRNKVVMHAVNKGDKALIGPYKKGSYEVVSNKCLMLNENGMKLHEDLVELVNLHKIDAYDYRTKKGMLRSVVYRKNELDEYMIILVVSKYTKRLENIIDKLKLDGKVKTVVVNINNGKRHHLLGNQNEIVYGDGNLTYNVDGVLLAISPQSFFQINTEVMKEMYRIIKDNVGENETVLDAYCGVGSITLYLADKVKEIVGIELGKSSYEDAKKNQELNNVENARFILGDVSKEAVKLENKFDTIITDPPRNGCSKEFIDFIIENKFDKIIYMSCNSATLARDLKMLSDEYTVTTAHVFDMFAHTSHSESIVVLKKM